MATPALDPAVPGVAMDCITKLTSVLNDSSFAFVDCAVTISAAQLSQESSVIPR